MKITILLRATIYFIILGMLSICLILLPELAREEKVANPDAVTLPYLIGAYILTIPVFTALYQTLKLAKYLDKGRAFTSDFVRTLRNIKYCTVAFASMVIVGALITMYVSRINNPNEDVTHVFVLTALFTFASSVIAVAVALFERLFQSAADIKSENDLIV